MLKLGSRIKDRLTGLTGICTGRTEYLFGCVQVCLSIEEKPANSKDPLGFWFDEDRCELIQEEAIKRPATVEERRGGPQDENSLPPGADSSMRQP